MIILTFTLLFQKGITLLIWKCGKRIEQKRVGTFWEAAMGITLSPIMRKVEI